MNDAPILLPLESLQPHPQNPRLFKRIETLSTLEHLIRTNGFNSRYAITARPLGGEYQILSGHNRCEAARAAGLEEVPAWVVEMDDDAAYMELVLSNTQSELSPLERGMHALAATEKGRHNGKSVKAYAKDVGRPDQSVDREVRAARVANSSVPGNFEPLSKRTEHLGEIHQAPEHCWPPLVERLVAEKWNVDQTKEAVKKVFAIKLPRGYEKLFVLAQLQEMVARGEEDVEVYVGNIRRAIERSRSDIREGFSGENYLEQFEQWLNESSADGRVPEPRQIYDRAQQLVEEQREAKKEAEARMAKLKRPVTLTEWRTLKEYERRIVLATRDLKAKLNKQDSTSIEWADWSWNPITGCLHNCPYCYARDLAERFYTQKFEPSIIPEALGAPLNSKPKDDSDVAAKNIFTCSMADLFGNWVPNEWIETVLSIVAEAKDWNFLMLTKFPQRLKEFKVPPNAWLGTSVDLQARVPVAERAMREVEASVKWLSIEPLIEPLTIDFSLFQWVVIGGASKSTQTPEWKPPRAWVYDLTLRARDAGCAVYHKDNLHLERLREYPGSVEEEPQKAPEPFQYLKVLA